MSYAYNQFTVNLSLQHLSMVKISQQLWRQSEISLKIDQILPPEDGMTSAEQVIKSVTTNSDDLDLPRPIRAHLRYYIKSMGKAMFRWLNDMCITMKTKKDPNDKVKLSHFLNNLTWDDFGSVDGRKMLESYIKTEESIDYNTWSQLCCYCTEDDIRKYSRCINWSNCSQIEGMLSIFWYYKTFGTYPKDSMFSSTAKLQEFDRAWRYGRLDEDRLMRTMFQESILEGNIWAVKFFWATLKDREKQEELSSGLNYYYRRCRKDYSDVYVFLIGQMDHVQLGHYLMEKGEIERLMVVMDWPWIFSILSWKEIFSAIGSKSCLWEILVRTLEVMGLERNLDCDFREFCSDKCYQVVEELWECCRDFLGEQDVGDVVDVGRRIVCMKDVRLCRIIFEDSRIREWILDEWRLVYDFSGWERLEDDFWREFIEGVLMDDSERQVFKNIFHENVKSVG